MEAIRTAFGGATMARTGQSPAPIEPGWRAEEKLPPTALPKLRNFALRRKKLCDIGPSAAPPPTPQSFTNQQGSVILYLC